MQTSAEQGDMLAFGHSRAFRLLTIMWGDERVGAVDVTHVKAPIAVDSLLHVSASL